MVGVLGKCVRKSNMLDIKYLNVCMAGAFISMSLFLPELFEILLGRYRLVIATPWRASGRTISETYQELKH